jgi:agmatinase
MGDIGDVTVNPNDPEETMAKVFQVSDKIYKNNSIPVFLGGDHSFPPEIVRALGENVDGNIGIIHFDSHMDNAKSFGNDKYPRCGPSWCTVGKVEKHRHIDSGPKLPAQMEYAKRWEPRCSRYTNIGAEDGR